MFRQPYTDDVFTSPVADSIFPNIKQRTDFTSSFDRSFLSTVRAVMGPRVPENEQIILDFRRAVYGSETLSSCSKEEIIQGLVGNNWVDGLFSIVNIAGDKDSNTEVFKIIDEMMPEMYPNFTKEEAVYAVLNSDSSRIRLYFSEAGHYCLIFAERVNTQKIHAMQIALTRIMPWYLCPGGDKAANEEERNLLMSLIMSEFSLDDYKTMINKFADKYDFRTYSIKTLLDGFELKFEREEGERLKQQINNILSNIRNYETHIAENMREYHNVNRRLTAINLMTGEEKESELMEYFIANKSLEVESLDGSRLTFTVHAPVVFFDSEEAESVIENHNSAIYHDRTIRGVDLGKLLKAIFVEKTLKLWFCSAFKLNVGERIYTLDNYSFAGKCSDCMPNPHINRYNCLGDYEHRINEAIMNGDYVGAVSTCVSSAYSLNWSDYTVMDYFYNQIGDNRGGKCIELPDGSRVTPKEAVEWIKKEGAENV